MHSVALTSPALSAYIALLVAFVAGAFSLLNLTVSKENTVSEFRQTWMDALREDISAFVAQAQWIHTETIEYLSGRVKDYTGHLDRIREPLVSMNQAATRVKLRLHEEERASSALMESMGALTELLRALSEESIDNRQYFDRFGPLSIRVEKDAAVILRSEWSRVKRGEHGYRVAKGFAYIALVISFAIIVLIAAGAAHAQ